MSEKILFRVAGIPKPLDRPRGRVLKLPGREPCVQMYQPFSTKMKEWRGDVKTVAEDVMRGRSILVGPLRVDLLILHPKPIAEFRKTMAMPRKPHDKRPDRDNLEKAVSDVLTGIVWKDDSQICDGRVTKLIASGYESPGICISIEPFDDEALSVFDAVEVHSPKMAF